MGRKHLHSWDTAWVGTELPAMNFRGQMPRECKETITGYCCTWAESTGHSVGGDSAFTYLKTLFRPPQLT